MSHKLFISLIILLLITAGAPATPLVPSSTPVSVAAERLDQKVDVGDYSLHIVCTGQGTPTVIIEADLGEPVIEGMTWYYVRTGIEKTNRICVYERARVASSGAIPTETRTSQDMVNDLHALLVQSNVQGPYILVGHYMGGLNARLYASQYPNDVTGMVLVDAMHPDYATKTLAVLPAESAEEPVSVRGLRFGLADFIVETPDGVIDLTTSAVQVRAADLPGDLPLVVITRSANWRNPSLPADIAEKVEGVWQALQQDLLNLSSNSSHVISTAPAYQKPPELPLNEPQLIIDAILKVIEESKK